MDQDHPATLCRCGYFKEGYEGRFLPNASRTEGQMNLTNLVQTESFGSDTSDCVGS